MISNTWCGLPDDEREEMVDYISTINSSISVHQIPRNEEAMGPYNFIPFLNNLAIMFKVRRRWKNNTHIKYNKREQKFLLFGTRDLQKGILFSI